MTFTHLPNAGRTVALLNAAFVVVVAVSLVVNVRLGAAKHEQMALVTARAVYETLVAARNWNAAHGGVYIPVSESTQPNPYLTTADRDVTTTAGRQLTLANPAYMTRMISEQLSGVDGIRIHLTSLQPLRPGNAADAWERGALEAFELAPREIHGVVDGANGAAFRFAAPLVVEPSCLACHAVQGYTVGQIRGGLAVSFPYAPYAAAAASARLRLVLAHLVVLLAGLLIAGLLGRRLQAAVRDLTESVAHIETLEGLLPICAGCKSIRSEATEGRRQEDWVPVESYLSDRTAARFSHGLCPECAERLYPGLGDDSSKA